MAVYERGTFEYVSRRIPFGWFCIRALLANKGKRNIFRVDGFPPSLPTMISRAATKPQERERQQGAHLEKVGWILRVGGSSDHGWRRKSHRFRRNDSKNNRLGSHCDEESTIAQAGVALRTLPG